MIAVYLGFLWILLQVTCSTEAYNVLPEENNTVDTLLGHHYHFTALHSAYDKGLPIKPLSVFERKKVRVPAVEKNAMASGCYGYSRPTSVKVAGLMLEMFRNLEGKDNNLIEDLVEKLIKSKVLVKASLLDSVPDLDISENYETFPRIMAMLWLTVTDPITTKNHGWCSIDHMSKYLSVTKPEKITSDINGLKLLVTEARDIIENFIMEVADPLFAESSEEHGQWHVQEQSPSLIKINAVPGFDDRQLQIRNNQKSRQRRQESHYQVRFEPLDDMLHKQRRRFQSLRRMNFNPFAERKKKRNYKMVRVVSESVAAPRRIIRIPLKESAASHSGTYIINCVVMILYMFILQ